MHLTNAKDDDHDQSSPRPHPGRCLRSLARSLNHFVAVALGLVVVVAAALVGLVLVSVDPRVVAVSRSGEGVHNIYGLLLRSGCVWGWRRGLSAGTHFEWGLRRRFLVLVVNARCQREDRMFPTNYFVTTGSGCVEGSLFRQSACRMRAASLTGPPGIICLLIKYILKSLYPRSHGSVTYAWVKYPIAVRHSKARACSHVPGRGGRVCPGSRGSNVGLCNITLHICA